MNDSDFLALDRLLLWWRYRVAEIAGVLICLSEKKFEDPSLVAMGLAEA
jgi:hypothetical protein